MTKIGSVFRDTIDGKEFRLVDIFKPTKTSDEVALLRSTKEPTIRQITMKNLLKYYEEIE